jgi:phthalate 4,5-cis-dihydrodiol dehydrogenase
MAERKLKLGVAGLGRAFMLMLPSFVADKRIALTACADPRPEARMQFEADYRGAAYDTVEALCENPDIDAVYIASPHQYHRAHVLAAAARGKHVLLEKPMALTLADCDDMIAACARAGTHLIVGHSHSFDLPYLRTRTIVASGAYGRVRMVNALNFTDFLYRPRRPEELVTAQGGGVVFSQGAHQIDIVRLLGGGKVHSVRAATGAWDKGRPTEGAYSAFLNFEDGAFASLTYSGYAHFDSDELCGWIGEGGQKKDPRNYGAARRALKSAVTPQDETALKMTRTYGAAKESGNAAPMQHNHFGLVVVSCERADLRPLPDGVMIFADDARTLDPLPAPAVPRAPVIDELYEAVVNGKTPLHSGAWGMATLEVCLAILESARQGRELTLLHQVAAGGV